jgi:F0F1-type ATP synthase assembly protein I
MRRPYVAAQRDFGEVAPEGRYVPAPSVAGVSVMNKTGVPALFKQSLLAQAAVSLATALAFGYYGRNAGFSALTGGLIVVVANVYSAWRVFSASKTETAEQALAMLYRAETGKLIMIVALFMVVFTGWKSVNIVAFVAGCAAAMITGLIGSAFHNVDQNISRNTGAGKETDG